MIILNSNVDLLKLSDKADSPPEYLCIEPTSRCNTKCTHCSHYYCNFGEDMDEIVFNKIRSSLFKTAKSIDLVGAGEPFIAKNFDRFFEECLKYNIKLSTTTNGIALRNEELTSKLVKSNILIRVSIDGARKETYEFVRPFHKWENMIKVLETIKKHAELAGSNKKFNFHINYVVMNQNADDIPEIIKLASKYGAEEIQFLALGDEEVLEKMKGQSIQKVPQKLIKPLITGISLARKMKIRLVIPKYFKKLILETKTSQNNAANTYNKFKILCTLLPDYVDKRKLHNVIKRFFSSFKSKNKFNITSCLLPWESTLISANGDVYPCCQMHLKMGNLNNQEWDEIWNGERYKHIRRTIHSWNPSMMCRYCHVPCGINGGNEKQYEMFFAKFKVKKIPLNSDTIKYISNFYELECHPDGSPSHIWMDKNGRMKIEKFKNVKFIRFLIIMNGPEQQFHTGYATINDGEKEYFDNTCKDICFPIEHVKGNDLDIKFTVEQSYKPPNDPRYLSLAIHGIEFLY